MGGKQKGNIGRHQRQRDLDPRIARQPSQAQAEPADGNAVSQFPDNDQNECSGGLAERRCAVTGDRDELRAKPLDRFEQSDDLGGRGVEMANDDEVAPSHSVAQNGHVTTLTLLLNDGPGAKVANSR